MSVKTRVRQFFRALFAKPSPEDMDYLEGHLDEKGLALFCRMAVFDQYHGIMTARTAEKFLEGKDAKEPLLIRAALLHDVGRTGVSIGDKVLCVLLDKIFPSWARGLSKVYHPLYLYYHHPAIGAKLLREAGFAEEGELVAKHHEKPRPDDRVELVLLRQADEEN